MRKNKSRIVEYALKGLKTKLDMRVKAIKTKEIDYSKDQKSQKTLLKPAHTRRKIKRTKISFFSQFPDFCLFLVI